MDHLKPDGSAKRPYRLMSSDEIEKVMEAQDHLKRELVMLPRGGKEWRAAYAKYRKTEWWKYINSLQLLEFPACEMDNLMAQKTVEADESHHRIYSRWFEERIGIDLVSVCKSCHLMWEQRRLRRHRGK